MPLETPSEEGESSTTQHHLPKLGARIRQAIGEYGGGVFPKLNWTAPRVCSSFFNLSGKEAFADQ
jgi:hypothetical protein